MKNKMLIKSLAILFHSFFCLVEGESFQEIGEK